MSIQVISFNCVLKNKIGQFISSTFIREVLNSPTSNKDVALRGLAKGLQNLKKGEKRSIFLPAEEAYGLYLPQKVILFPRKKLPRTLGVGQIVTIMDKNGKMISYKVIEFHNDTVSLDGNHPLAGQDLIFEIETIEAREATPEEVTASTNSTLEQILH